jgi:hypothetical protein
VSDCEYALLARCGEMIMDVRRDDEEARQVRTAIQGKLLLKWMIYLHNLKKQQKQQSVVRALAEATATDASRSPKTTTWRGSTADRGGRGGIKRSMQDIVNSHNHTTSSVIRDIDDRALSLREKLAQPEYPLFILVKLLLMHRQLDTAILIVVTMEKEDVFDYLILFHAYKLLFQFLVDDGHLLFDTCAEVPPVESLHCTFFPLVGQNGIRILAHLHCEVLERIQALQTPESGAMTQEQAFVRHSCLRALLRMLGTRHSLQEGLKLYEELRRDARFAAVLVGPLSIERAKDICENECQLPSSGFPDIVALLVGPQESVDEEEEDGVTSENALPIVAEAVATHHATSTATILLVESDEEEEFYDALAHHQEEEEDHGYDAAEESQGEPQPEDMAMVDSTQLVQQPRQEETTMLAPPPSRSHFDGDDDDEGYVATAESSQDRAIAKTVNVARRIPTFDEGYDANAEESQGQDDVAQPPPTRKRVDYDADDSQGQTEEDEDAPASTLKERKPEAISTTVVAKPVAAPASLQGAERPDDSVRNQDHGYDAAAEESQGHSDEEDVPMNVAHADLHQQTDNGYDAEESQAGHFTEEEEGSVEFESTTVQEPVDRRHVAFAPLVQPVAAQPENDPGYLRDNHTGENKVAADRTERDGYQSGESSVQRSEEEEEEVSDTMASTEVADTLPSTDDEDDENNALAALDGQEDAADESPGHEPRHPSAAHRSSDMDAAKEQTMDPAEDTAREHSDHDNDVDDDDDDDGSEDMPDLPPSGGAATSRSSLHAYAAAAQDEYSPTNRHIRADNGREVAPTPGSRASSRDDTIFILDDSTSSDEAESEDSAPPEGSSRPQGPDYDEADEQDMDDEEEMDEEEEVDEDDEEEMGSSFHSSGSPARKPSAYGEESPQSYTRAHEQKEGGLYSTYSSPSPQGRTSDKHVAASSTYSTPSAERKHPAKETSLPKRDEEAAADEAVISEDAGMAGDETKDVPFAVANVEKSSAVVDIADSPTIDKEMGDGVVDSFGDDAAPKQASAAVNEAGSGPTADTTMEDVAEIVIDGAPNEKGILDGPLTDTRTDTTETNKDSIADEEAGERTAPASMNVQPQEETVDAIFAGVAQEEAAGAVIGAVQQSQEVVELLDSDSDSDDAETDKAGGDAPMDDPDADTETDEGSTEESDAGTDADQDSADDANDDVDVDFESTSAVQQAQVVVAVDRDIEMFETGGAVPLEEQDAGANANHDAAAADVENNRFLQESQNEQDGAQRNKQPGREEPVGVVDDSSEPADTKMEAVAGREASGGAEVESAPTGDIDDRNAAESSDALAFCAQTVVATGEQESHHAVDVTEERPESTLNDDGGVDADASTGEEKEASHAELKEGGTEGEADDAAVQATGTRRLVNPLAPIPEQEVVDESADHAIREISTSNPTIVDEDVDVHPPDQDGQDDDAPPAAGSDDENGSRRSRSTRGSARVTRQAWTTTPQRPPRGSICDDDGGSIASHTRAASAKKKRGDVGDDESASAPPKRGRGRPKGSTKNSKAPPPTPPSPPTAEKKRGDVGDDESANAPPKRGRGRPKGSTKKAKAPPPTSPTPVTAKKTRTDASSDDGGSIASHTRASAKKKRGDVADEDGAANTRARGSQGGAMAQAAPRGDEDGAPNTRARGSQGGATAQATPRASSKKPPRPPPSTNKEK